MDNSQESVRWSRRTFVSLMASVPLAWSLPSPAAAAPTSADSFPAKDEFDIKGTFINAAYTHPMSKGSFNEIKTFLNDRMVNRQGIKGYNAYDRTKALNNFAKLINASPDEIAWVPSTMVGENFVVSGLSLPGSTE